MNVKIAVFLRKIGLRATYVGFNYLVSAIEMVLSDDDYLQCLTTRLYPEIAQKYQISAASVERSLRTLLEVFWSRGNVPLLEELLGYPLPSKPSTGEFIDILSSHFRLCACSAPTAAG